MDNKGEEIRLNSVSSGQEEVEQNVQESEFDAIYCKVTVGNITVECWGCDCAKIATQMQEFDRNSGN